MEIKRYSILVNELVETLEENEATYAEAFEALEGTRKRLNHRLESIKLNGEINGI